MSEAFRTPEYWNERTRRGIERNDYKNMLFEDGRFDMYEGRTKEMLSLWKDFRVLDVACGYGRFADIFDKYTGIDFSQEMVGLAKKKNPGKTFMQVRADEFKPSGKYDIVFEVNSLHSLGMTPEEFFERFGPMARKMVCCLEADKFTIFQIYG